MGKLFFATCVVFLAVASAGLGQISHLPSLNIYPQWLTISGFSSGGSFAQQLQISYSSLFSGIAVFSHTYYRCGPATGVQEDYDNVCTRLGNRSDSELYDTANVLTDIQNYYDQDLIDNPINIRNKRLYVFAGTRNPLFTTDMSLRILQVYEPLIQNTEAVHTRVMEAQLLFPTVDFGAPCQESAESNLFLGSCGISGAYEALQFLLGDVVKKPSRVQRVAVQRLREFDQTEFLYGFTGRHDMDTVGYYYVPSRCEYIKCLLHFYFHGCLTGREFNGTSHIVNSGYLEVAELSNIIMVFPQAVSSEGNEIGCWDTYGFTGLQYATKRGHQVTVVRNILARVLGEDSPRGEGGQGVQGEGSQGQGASFLPEPSGLYLPPIQTNHVSDGSSYSVISTSSNPVFDEVNTLHQQTSSTPNQFENSYLPPPQQVYNPRLPSYPERQYSVNQASDGSLYSVPSSPTSYYTSLQSFKK